MSSKRFLATFLLTLTLLIMFVGVSPVLAQDNDTIYIGNVQVDPDPSNPVVFSVPVTVHFVNTIAGSSLGHYYDSDDVTIDSITFTGGIVPAGAFNQSQAVPANNLAVVGWVAFSAAGWISPQNGLIANMWFTLNAGAPDQVITIDSGYFPPAGDYVLTKSDGQSTFPDFVGGTITVGAGAPQAELIVDPTTLTFDATQGGANPTSKTFDITNGGGGTLDWTASEDIPWLTLNTYSGSAPSTVTVNIDISGVSAGTYEQDITIASPGATGSPQTVTVTLNVAAPPPEIALMPESFAFEVVQGEKATLYDTLNITNNGGGDLNWTAAKLQSWLTLNPTSGTAPSDMELQVISDGLTAGVYYDTITVNATGATNTPQEVPVTLTVTEPAPEISVAPATLDFNATVGGGNPADQLFAVSNTGGQTLNYNLAKTQAWLTVDPTSGSLGSGASDDITASIDITGLAAGVYTDTVTVTGNAANSPQKVAINLTLNEAPAAISVDPAEFTFDVTVGGNPADQTMDITNGGGGTLDFTLSKLQDWLTLDPTSGTAPSTITLSVSSSSMAVGVYYDTITVAAAGATNTPVEVPVTLNVFDVSPVIVLDQSQFTFDLVEGDNQAMDDLGITNGGGGDLIWAASNIESWLALDPTSGTAPSTVGLTVSSNGLAVGTYYDTISVVSIDAANSPQKAEVILNVHAQPEFDVTQGGLNITQLIFDGQLTKSLDPQVISITSTGLPIDWFESHSTDWLGVEPPNGTTPTDVTVSVDITGLGEGTYYDTLRIFEGTPGKQAGEYDLEVVLTLAAPQAEFVVTPTSFSFSMVEGGTLPDAQNLNIASDGSPLGWDATFASGWLALDATSGTTPTDVSVSVGSAAQALGAGEYHDTIAIANTIIEKQAVTVYVPVTLTIEGAPQPVLSVSPLALNFEATEGGMNPDSQLVDITNTGSGVLDWTAAWDAAWININPSSGTAPSTMAVSMDFAGLIADTYIDTITISAAGAENSPQYIEVTLVVNPASSQGGDTVWVGFDSTFVGQQAMVEITFSNDNLISGIGIPLYYNKDLMVCDSVSFAGSRVENADMLLAPIDTAAGTIDIGVIPTEAELIPIGTGLLAKLYFTALDVGFAAIDTGFIAPASEYVFVDEFVNPFYPVFHSGGVAISEPVAPCIEPSALSFDFEAVLGGANPADQYLTITNCGSGTLAWTVSNVSPWLTLSPVSGGDGDMTTLSVSIASLGIGTYYDTITIADPTATNSPVLVPVTLMVNEPGPTMDTVRVVSREVVSSPTDPVPFNVEITLFNTDTLSAASLGLYYNSDDIEIDSIVLTGGTAEGTANQSIIKPDTNLAAVGFVWFPGMTPVIPGDSLLANLWFTLAAGAPDQVIDVDSGYFPPAGPFILTSFNGMSVEPAFVPGTITVVSEAEPPVLSVTPTELLFEGEEGGTNNVIQNVYIANTGAGDLNWTASFSAAWLSVDPTSGTNGDTLSVSVDLTGLMADTYIDTIMISAPGADNSPQGVVVTLNVTPPQMMTLSGTVIDMNTTDPIPDAMVELYDMYPGTPMATAMTDTNGEFMFEDLMPDEYVLRAYKDGYYPTNIDVMLSKEVVEMELQPTGEFTPTYEWVNFYCDMNYLNDELIMPGDVVEAFNPAGTLCGQYFVTEEGTYGFMPVYRDDEYTEDIVEGCVPGDQVSFKINGYPAETSEEAFWTENGDEFEICLDAQSIVTRCIHLNEGWNLISWNVDTESDDIEDLIADIKDRVDVILGFESGAMTYDPDLPDFNTLFAMDNFHGYWFRMLDTATFCVSGMPVDPTTPIALEMGWNLVSYLPDEEDDLENALSSIMDDLLVVLGFYDGGVSYQPSLGGYNTLLVLKPDYGYWIKVSQAAMLTYPGMVIPSFAKLAPDDFSSGSDNYVTNHWVNLFGTGVSVDGETLESGALLEAVDASGNVCGSYTVRENGKFGFMPVYGAEDGTAAGLKTGDVFTIRVNGQETEEAFTYESDGSRILVSSLTLKGGHSGAIPTAYKLGQNYPNPFNPETNISYEIPADSKVELSIYNILGEKVATLVNEFKAAGSYEVTWNGTRDDGTTVSSGIYFYRLNAGDFVKSMKMSLMK